MVSKVCDGFIGDPITSKRRAQRLMHTLAFICFVSLIPLTVSSADEIKPGETLDLKRCIAIALRYHPNLMSANGALYASRSRVFQAKSNYYPQVNWSNDYSRIHPAGGSGLIGNGDSAYDQYQSTVGLNQKLFDFGATSTQVKVNSLGADASQADLEDVSSQVILGVKQAYYGVLQTKQAKDAYAETVVQFQQRLEQARRFYEVGIRPKIDVTTAEVDLSQSKLNLLKAENAVRIAKITLNNAIGIPDAPGYEIQQIETFQDFSIDLETALKRGYEKRPDLISAMAKRDAAERSIELAQKGYFPVLTGSAGYGWLGQDFPLNSEWSYGATLSFPLFTGFLTRYQVEEARGNLDVAKGNEELVRQNVRYDVEQAFYNLRDAREGIVLAEVSVRQAKENREIAQGRYAAGVGNTIEVTDAVVAEINAKTSYINALFFYRVAVANLEKAMGARE